MAEICGEKLALVLGALLLGLVVGLGAGIFAYPALFPTGESTVDPLFSPGAEPTLVGLIDSAQSTIDIEVYTFSSQALKDALVQAAGRGVKVRLILEPKLEDPSSNQKTFYYLKGNGVDVRWATAAFTLTHSKFMIIDGKKVLVGSHNFSNAALKTNREAGVIITGPAVAEFEDIFQKDWGMAS